MSVSPSCRALIIAGVPAPLASPAAQQEEPASPHPVVLWFHGFGADALAHTAELERCAASGFLAVGVDATGHGARAQADLANRIARTPGGALSVMLDLVEETAQELPALIHELARTHEADAARVSAVGISMGAFLVYRTIALGTPLRAAVALLGSPEWPGPSSAHLALDAFRDVRLLSITAEHDGSVPPMATARLHMALHTRFGAECVQRLHVLRGAGHLTSAHEWHEAMTVTMDWLRRFR